MTNKQKQYFWGLLKKAYPLIPDEEKNELKKQLVATYTSSRTDSLSEMYPHEIHNMIKDLQKLAPRTIDKDADKQDRMRKKVIGLFRQMGYERDGRADMVRIQAFVQARGLFKKSLNEHSTSELVKLTTQIEQIYEKTRESGHYPVKVDTKTQ